jgi:hypothetical protein
MYFSTVQTSEVILWDKISEIKFVFWIRIVGELKRDGNFKK